MDLHILQERAGMSKKKHKDLLGVLISTLGSDIWVVLIFTLILWCLKKQLPEKFAMINNIFLIFSV